MRRAKDLLARILLTLALVVAAWPARAGESACAPTPRVRCAMPCCAKRAMAHCASRLLSRGEGLRVRGQGRCPCEIGAALPNAAVVRAVPVPTDDAAVLPKIAVPATVARLAPRKPGIVGLDAGPPPEPPRLHDASRAPPFVRARPFSSSH